MLSAFKRIILVNSFNFRPTPGSAFSAYVPGKSSSSSSHGNHRYNINNINNISNSPTKQYPGLDSLRSRTNYLTNLGSAGDER